MAFTLEDHNEHDTADKLQEEITRVERVVSDISNELYDAEEELSELKEKLRDITL